MKKIIPTLIAIVLIAILGMSILFNNGYKVVLENKGISLSKIEDLTDYVSKPYKSRTIQIIDKNKEFVYTYPEAGVEFVLSGVREGSMFVNLRKSQLSLNLPINAQVCTDIINSRTTYSAGELKLDDEYNLVIEGNQEGNTIDSGRFYYDLSQKIKTGNSVLINLENYYIEDPTSELEKTMLKSIEDYNGFFIKYSNGFELNSKVLAKRKLIKVQDDGTYAINISDSICRDICGKNLTGYNSIGIDRDFTTHDGREIKIKSVTYGNYIDYGKEAEYLMDAIENRTSELNRVPILKQKEEFLLGDTYLELDKSLQKVFYYEDGELKLETDVVTGLPTSKRDTPSGIYFIINKATDTPLVGESWNVKVKYWMGVTYQGVGFHDASWRSKFGGSIWKSNGSHGCINTPTENMKKLFEMVQVGTPVVIY